MTPQDSAPTALTPAEAPHEAPPGDLATKQEPEAPRVVDKAILGPDSYVEKFSDGKFTLPTQAPESTSQNSFCQTFLKQTQKRVASSTVPTALASQPDEDEEPIEWGDMGPSFSRMLQSTPSMLAAYKALRTPKKMAKLDASTGSFQPSTDIPMPEVSPDVKLPENITPDNLRSTLQHYHETSVQPSMELLKKHIREEVTRRIERNEFQQHLCSYSLSAIESEQQRRSVIIYNIPHMSSVTQNLNYLLGEAGLSNSDTQSISNHLHTSSSAFMRVIFL